MQSRSAAKPQIGPQTETGGKVTRQLRAKAYFVAAALCYAITLSWSYKNIAVPVWGYAGAELKDVRAEITLVLYCLAALPTAWLSASAKRPSNAALAVFYALAYVPFVVVSYHVLPWTDAAILGLDLFLMANLLLIRMVASLPVRRVRVVRIGQRQFIRFMLLATAFLAIAGSAANGFKIDLSISDVYTRRLAARETVTARSGMGYATSLLASTFIPASLSLGIALSKRRLVIVSMFAVMVLFSLAGQKSVLLTPILIGGAYLLAKRQRLHFGPAVLVTLALLLAASDLTAKATGNIVPSALMYRLLAAAGINMSRYFDFFSSNPYYLFSSSVLKAFSWSQYDRPMSMMLGSHYGGSDVLNLNSNVWAAAFGDAGYVGVALVSLALGLTLWITDALTSERNPEACVAVGAFIGFMFAAMAAPSVFLTGGVAPTLLLLYLFKGTERHKIGLQLAE